VNSLNDKAHNFILDWFLDGGLILVLAGGYLLYLIFNRVVLHFRDNNLLIYLGSALGAYLFSLLFSFEFIAGAMVFWLFTAMILFSKESNLSWKINKICIYLFLIFSLSLLVWSTWSKYSDVNALRMRYVLGQGDYYQAGHYYLLANSGRQRVGHYDFLITESLASNRGESRDIFVSSIKTLWQRGANLFQDNNVYSLVNAVQAKILLKDYVGAVEISQDLTNEFSNWPLVWEMSARANLLNGDSNKALANILLAEKLLPDYKDKRLNQEHYSSLVGYFSQLSILRAEVYVQERDYSAALVAYKKALSYNLDINLYKKIADCYYLLGDMVSSQYYLKRAMTLDPDNYSWPFSLALSYQISGNELMAQEYLTKALFLAPDNENLKLWQAKIK
jgi:tetratricopeptide (TPR) repeat protein